MAKKEITPKDPQAQAKSDNEVDKSAERKTLLGRWGRKVARKTAGACAGR